MSRGGQTLYVTGFSHGTRAKDLAYEFERYGRLVRCDIPAPRTNTSRLFAFVEYESRRDADDAYFEMHNRRFGRDGDILKVEWARTPPSASWRYDAGTGRESREYGRRARSPPPRRGRSTSYGRDSPRGRDKRGSERARSRSPVVKRDSVSPVRKRDDDDRDRSPPPRHSNGDDRRGSTPLKNEHDDLDTADLAD